jgi:leader peptidase (prepilin peptidase)/N-methyltransferase
MINQEVAQEIFNLGGGTIVIVLSFFFGLILGSFLNVCIYRLPRKESLVWPSSHCPQCGFQIPAFDNIPIISYILLKGRCRSCQAPIPFRYPLIELLTGILFALVALRYHLTSYTFFSLCFTAILIVIAFIDLEHRIIPNILNYLGIILAAIGLLFSFLPTTPLEGSIGFLLGGGIFYLAAIVSPILFKKEGMGGGDIKLIAFIGLFLGWQKVLLTIFLGSLIGAILGLGLIATGVNKKKELIPFGPYLSLAGFIALMWGEGLIDWYLRIAM